VIAPEEQVIAPKEQVIAPEEQVIGLLRGASAAWERAWARSHIAPFVTGLP
jgi:hypothetical protein